MAILILGLVLFLGVHSIRIVADGWRTATIGRVGELPWKAVYALLSIAEEGMRIMTGLFLDIAEKGAPASLRGECPAP